MKFTPFMIISLASWALLVVTAVASLFVPKEYSSYFEYIRAKSFWITFGFKIKVFSEFLFYPILMDYTIFYICFIILIGLIVLSCCLMIFGMIKSEYSSGMFGSISKFHFIPLLCTSALFIIGESLDPDFNPSKDSKDDIKNREKDNDARHLCSLIFTLIGLCTLIFIHFKTDVSNSKIFHYIIKQITYGWLIVMLVYNLFFSIYSYGSRKNSENFLYSKSKYIENFSNKCSLGFSIVMGIVNLGISFLLKNAIICIGNFVIYLGMTIFFFNLDDWLKKYDDAEGGIDITMMALSLILLGFLIYKYKSQILI